MPNPNQNENGTLDQRADADDTGEERQQQRGNQADVTVEEQYEDPAADTDGDEDENDDDDLEDDDLDKEPGVQRG